MNRVAKAIGFRPTLCLLLLAVLANAVCSFDTSGLPPSAPPDSSKFYKCEEKMKACGKGTEAIQPTVSGPPVYNIAGTYQMDADFGVNDGLYVNSGSAWIVQSIEHEPLRGGILFRPNRDHWKVGVGQFLDVDFPSFDHIGDLYIAYDDRVNPKPQWLLNTQNYAPVLDAAGKQLHIVTSMPDATNASPTVRLALYRVFYKVQGHPFGEPMWRIPGNNCLAVSASGGCTGTVTWPKKSPDGNKAMYVVILTRKELPDCSKGTIEEQNVFEGCQGAEQDAKTEALKKCEEERQRKSLIGQNPAFFKCLDPVCKEVTLCPQKKGLVQNRSFHVSSVVEFNPSKYKSEAHISLPKQGTTTRKVEGLIYFEYLLDEFDSLMEMRLDSVDLKVDPIDSEAGRFEDIVLALRQKAKASCQESPRPWGGDRPCTHYTIPSGAFRLLLGALHESKTLLFDPQNTNLIDIWIDHKNRTFQIKGGPLSTSVQVKGKSLPMDIDIDLFGHFLNFAPHAVGRKESTRWVECAAGRDKARTNKDPIHLDSAGSFEVYKDPIPPQNYEWYEDYTWPPQKLWGTGPKLNVPAHTMSLGVHEMTLLVRDPIGISDTDTFPIEVRDTQGPEITVPPDVHRLLTPPDKPPVQVNLGTASAWDACFGDVEITNDAPADGRFPAGVTTVTWTAEDGAGNKDTGVQKVEVYTTKAPPVPTAQAGGPCEEYARVSLDQARENIERGCRFQGGRWGSDFRVHYDWCLKAAPGQAEGTTQQRAYALRAQCVPARPSIEQTPPAPSYTPPPGATPPPPPQSAKQARCQAYAELAVARNQENLERGCGFTGLRWLSDNDAHYRWCLGAPGFMADMEANARAEQLGRCGAGAPSVAPPPAIPQAPWPPPAQAPATPWPTAPQQPAPDNQGRCAAYAQQAVAQVREGVARRCDFTGPRWSGDYNVHFNWCLNVPQEATDGETQARSNDLQTQCRGLPVVE